MLVLKPQGRGNWAATYVQFSGARTKPLLFHPGQTITLGGAVWRICRIHT